MEIIGLDEVKIKKISKMKNGSRDILDYRLKCYEMFKKIDLPHFGPKINIDFTMKYQMVLFYIVVNSFLLNVSFLFAEFLSLYYYHNLLLILST